MMSQITPGILCGGSGTRLWPRSRAVRPKPFLPLVGDSTLFEATLQRCPPDGGFAAPLVVTGPALLLSATSVLPPAPVATPLLPGDSWPVDVDDAIAGASSAHATSRDRAAIQARAIRARIREV